MYMTSVVAVVVCVADLVVLPGYDVAFSVRFCCAFWYPMNGDGGVYGTCWGRRGGDGADVVVGSGVEVIIICLCGTGFRTNWL